jgi:hypothetical protein
MNRGFQAFSAKAAPTGPKPFVAPPKNGNGNGNGASTGNGNGNGAQPEIMAGGVLPLLAIGAVLWFITQK